MAVGVTSFPSTSQQERPLLSMHNELLKPRKAWGARPGERQREHSTAIAVASTSIRLALVAVVDALVTDAVPMMAACGHCAQLADSSFLSVLGPAQDLCPSRGGSALPAPCHENSAQQWSLLLASYPTWKLASLRRMLLDGPTSQAFCADMARVVAWAYAALVLLLVLLAPQRRSLPALLHAVFM